MNIDFSKISNKSHIRIEHGKEVLLIINNFPRDIEISKSQRAKLDKTTGKIKNLKKIGTPNIKRINGQEFYSGINPFVRTKIVKELHKFWQDKLRLAISKLYISPLRLEYRPFKLFFEYHIPYNDILKSGKGDIDNFSFIYSKTLQDSLVNTCILPEDNASIISTIINRFVPLSEDILATGYIDNYIQIYIEPDEEFQATFLHHSTGDNKQLRLAL